MEKFIQKLHLKKGALHRELGLGPNEHIPTEVLDTIMKGAIGTHFTFRGKVHLINHLLKRRATLAHTLR